jgi:hypothetical protein
MSNKSSSTTPDLRTETVPANFNPSQTQINALARRLIPEIKRFFADEEVQREFAEWQARQNATRSDK